MNIAICVNPLRDEVLTGIGYTCLYYINSLIENDETNTYFLFSNREIKHLERINKSFNFFHFDKNSFLQKKLDYYNRRIKLNKINKRPILALSVRRFFYKVLNEICFYVKINHQLKKNKIDLILFMDVSGVIQFYPGKIKKIAVVYDLVWKRYPETMEFTHLIRTKVLAGNFIKKCDRIIAISDSTRRDCIQFLNLKKPVDVIHLGIDLERFTMSSAEKVDEVLQKFNISKKYVLAVGTLEPRKNLLQLIKAFSLLENDNLFQLVLVGVNGWGGVDIFEVIKQYNIESSTIITGYVMDDELDALYTGAGVFVYPSIYEGFGLPILEAMSCGCPVITSDNSSMPEVANDAAIFVNAYDVTGLKNAIVNVLYNRDLRREMRIKGFDNVNNFSWERTARQAVEVFKKYE